MRQVEATIGRPIEVEALTVNNSATYCPTKSSESTFFDTDFPGKTAWIAPRPGQERSTILCYLRKKSKFPETSAVLVLPKTAGGGKVPWASLLANLPHIKLVKQIAKGETGVWRDATHLRNTSRFRAADIFYDPPGTAEEACRDPLNSTQTMCTMKTDLPDFLFATSCEGIHTTTLVDTGATANFVTAAVAGRLSARLKPATEKQVHGAGNNAVQIHGTVALPIQMGNYTATLQAYVVPQIIDGVDVVLGKRWQRENQTQLNMGNSPRLKIRPPCKHAVIAYPLGLPNAAATAEPRIPKTEDPIATQRVTECSYKAAKKALDAGHSYFLVTVREVSEGGDRSYEHTLNDTYGTSAPDVPASEHIAGGGRHRGPHDWRDLDPMRGKPERTQTLAAATIAERGTHHSAHKGRHAADKAQNTYKSEQNRRERSRSPSPEPGSKPKPNHGSRRLPDREDRPTPRKSAPRKTDEGAWYRPGQEATPPGRGGQPPHPAIPPPPPVTAEAARDLGIVHPENIEALKAEFADVFREELPARRPGEGLIQPEAYHAIPLVTGAQPPRPRHRRMSPPEHALCKEYVEDLLKKGFITPSTSPFGAPIMFIVKPSGGYRVVCDWRALNAITVKNRYPMPRIDETLDRLGGANLFTSFDLNSGYFQLVIDPKDCAKTAFTTPMGLYEFKVLGQGLANAPATFQAVMNRLFSSVLNKFVVVYLDDILVYSKTPEEHEQHLRIVLQILREANLYAKPSKCKFNQREVKFLGHIVGQQGIRPDPAKVDAVRCWPKPDSIKAVQQFLGLTNYFRKFIKDHATLASPLMSLTKKHTDVKAMWTPLHDECFVALKEALMSAPLLVYPDFSKPFELVSDASLIGTGAVLLQEGHPVAYTSKKLSPAEVRYTTTEQEMLGVVRALQEWRCYFTGEADYLTVVTDHNPLTYFDSKPQLSRRLERWVEELSRYNYKWQYRKGTNNVADPISRSPAMMSMFTRFVAKIRSTTPSFGDPCPEHDPITRNPILMCTAFTLTVEALKPRQPSSGRPRPEPDLLWRIKEAYVRHPTSIRKVYTFAEGVYYFRNRIVIPQDDTLRNIILHSAHDQPVAGHKGVQRTLELVQRNFYWPSMEEDVKTYVSTCRSCQQHKTDRMKPAGLLQPVEIPNHAFEVVTMDLITCLPKTPSGNDTIVTFVDKLSKTVRLAACNINIDGPGMARLFMDHVWRYNGLPKKIITDRDGRFTSHFSDALATSLGIRQALSTAFHPQTDGQTEIMNRYVEDTLRHYVNPTQDDWDRWLAVAEFAINNTLNVTINNTPFRMLLGRDPDTPETIQLPPKSVPAARKWMADVVQRTERARYCARAAADRQKTAADKHRRNVQYSVGTWVWLSTKNLKFKADGTKKFFPKFIGPFYITSAIGPRTGLDRDSIHPQAAKHIATAYKLDLPNTVKVHPVFHVSLLKEWKGRPGEKPKRPAITVDADGVPIFEAHAIVDEEVKHGKRMFLIRWTGYGPEADTWEQMENILSNGLIEDWRKKRPGPPPPPKLVERNKYPVTAFRPRTRNEDKRLQALAKQAEPPDVEDVSEDPAAEPAAHPAGPGPAPLATPGVPTAASHNPPLTLTQERYLQHVDSLGDLWVMPGSTETRQPKRKAVTWGDGKSTAKRQKTKEPRKRGTQKTLAALALVHPSLAAMMMMA